MEVPHRSDRSVVSHVDVQHNTLSGVHMPVLATYGPHHIRLTVTDIDRSRDFYRDVLGFEIVAQSPGRPDDPEVRTDPFRLYGGCVFRAGAMLLGLRPVAPAGDSFDSERVGLDHLSFSVDSKQDLFTAAERLGAAGIGHGEVIEMDQFGIAILSFDDPDGIHLELTAPL
ncbi:VOC family protein [Nocardia jinanensis]|uniref:Glyoxalase n=1 Tax=Nocardia jinanensis TaxID=382504 RepID=A0A917RU68_9NOCA|nr:VOC family protein [Nocardia jinanensis]GGL32848.1 glyoxalase [Nocardia jinanensis]